MPSPNHSLHPVNDARPAGWRARALRCGRNGIHATLLLRWRRLPRRSRVFLLIFALAGFALAPVMAWARPPATDTEDEPPLPPRRVGEGNIAIGYEYALIQDPRIVAERARAFAGIGLTAMKHYPDHVRWDEMQPGPDAPIDFSRLDSFVREYQAAGFTHLVIALKTHSRWGSKDVGRLRTTNASPKPGHREDFGRWVAAVVERYSGPGENAMPGLRFPVREFEIGVELSSYQPEPVAEYLDTLELAYNAAKAVSPQVRISHAAFLPTTAFADPPGHPSKEAYDQAFARMHPRISAHHDLASMRAVLDRPEIFDVVNFHALSDPYEIEHVVRWLRWEMRQRGYKKPIIISDTTTTSFIAWGPATTSEGPPERLGIITPPAREADRDRLADYFSKLVHGDKPTLAWTRAFIAADTVQRAVIAAEQRVELINLAFTTDLPLLTGRLAQAGAGVTAWAGLIDTNLRGEITGSRPNFHAVRQLMGHLHPYRSIRRLPADDDRARIYEVHKENGRFWIAWMNPKRLILPGDEVPSIDIALPVGGAQAWVEPVITREGQTRPEREIRGTEAGSLKLTVTPAPVYVFPDAATGAGD